MTDITPLKSLILERYEKQTQKTMICKIFFEIQSGIAAS